MCTRLAGASVSITHTHYLIGHLTCVHSSAFSIDTCAGNNNNNEINVNNQCLLSIVPMKLSPKNTSGALHSSIFNHVGGCTRQQAPDVAQDE